MLLCGGSTKHSTHSQKDYSKWTSYKPACPNPPTFSDCHVCSGMDHATIAPYIVGEHSVVTKPNKSTIGGIGKAPWGITSPFALHNLTITA